MKRRQKPTHFFAGFFVALLLAYTVFPAMAASGSGKTITVYPGVSMYLNDIKIEAVDVNGNPVDVFYYNGTTYVPIRAVSKAFGLPIQWDGSTKSVYIGSHTGDKPAAWLSDLDYFYKDGHWSFDVTSTDNLGNEHENSIDCWSTPTGDHQPSVVYKLNGQYTRLTGLYYQEYRYRSNSERSKLFILADGEKIWEATVGPRIDPVEIDLDITGVIELEFKYDFFEGEDTALGDMGLWT